jgi:hypothetical protein
LSVIIASRSTTAIGKRLRQQSAPASCNFYASFCRVSLFSRPKIFSPLRAQTRVGDQGQKDKSGKHGEELLLWTHNGNYYAQISIRIDVNQIEFYIFRVWINCSLVKVCSKFVTTL